MRRSRVIMAPGPTWAPLQFDPVTEKGEIATEYAHHPSIGRAPSVFDHAAQSGDV
jgi:hypothetical protein